MRTPLRTVVSVLVLGAPWSVPPALAQLLATGTPAPSPVIDMPPDSRQISLTLGAGLAKRTLYCGGCSQGLGFSGVANLSRFVGQSTALGMESTVWVKSAGPATAALLSAMGAATFWLDEQVPLSVSVGLGFIAYHEAHADYGSNTTSAGFGCSGRLGFDMRVTRRFALVPYVGYINSLGRLHVGRTDQVVSNVHFGMAFRFR